MAETRSAHLVSVRLAAVVLAAAVSMIACAAHAQSGGNLPPPGAYQPIPNYTGIGAGLLFRNAINDRFSGVQPVSPTIVNLAFTNLPTEQDGALIYCNNCVAAVPCAAGGAGAWAFGAQGQWECTAPGKAASGSNTDITSMSAINSITGASGSSPAVLSNMSTNSVINVKAAPYNAKGDGLAAFAQVTASSNAITLGDVNFNFANGNGTSVTFGKRLFISDGVTISPGSVSVVSASPSQTCADNGSGGFSGSGCVGGSINYTTGLFSVTFSTAPVSSTAVDVSDTQLGFASNQVGRGVWIPGAGASGNALVTTIASVTDASHATLAASASTSVANANFVWGDDDTAAIQSAYNALQPGQTLFFPIGYYVTSSVLEDNVQGTRTLGAGGKSSDYIQSTYGSSGKMAWLHGSVIFNVGNGRDGLHYMTDTSGNLGDGGGVDNMVFGSLGRREGLTGLTITSASESGNIVTLTMASTVPSDIKPNTEIAISGASVAGYNWPAAGVISASGTTITYYDYYVGLGAATGGTVSVLPVGLAIGSTANVAMSGSTGTGLYMNHVIADNNELQNWGVGLSFSGQYSKIVSNEIGSNVIGYLLNGDTNSSVFKNDGSWAASGAGFLSYYGTGDEWGGNEVEQATGDGMAIYDCENCFIHNNYLETESPLTMSGDQLRISSIETTYTLPYPNCSNVTALDNHGGGNATANAIIEVANECSHVSILDNDLRNVVPADSILISSSTVTNSRIAGNAYPGSLVNNGSTSAPGWIQDGSANVLTPTTFKNTVTISGTGTTTLTTDGKASFSNAVSAGGLYLGITAGTGIFMGNQSCLWMNGSEGFLDSCGGYASDWKATVPVKFGNSTTAITGTSGTATCTQPTRGNLKSATCYLNGYANTGTAQTFTYPTAFSTTPVLLESGGSCGTYNPTTTASTLTLPANASMTAETCNVVAIGQ